MKVLFLLVIFSFLSISSYAGSNIDNPPLADNKTEATHLTDKCCKANKSKIDLTQNPEKLKERAAQLAGNKAGEKAGGAVKDNDQVQ